MSNNLKSSLGKFAEAIQSKVQNAFRADGSQSLYRSITVDVNPTTLEASVVGNDDVIQANNGQSPGIFPNITELQEWIISRGIPLEATFPIAITIERDGVEPKNFIDRAVSSIRDTDLDVVANAAVEDFLNGLDI